MAEFFDKIFGFLNNKSDDAENVSAGDVQQNLEDLIDVSWAGYSTK